MKDIGYSWNVYATHVKIRVHVQGTPTALQMSVNTDLIIIVPALNTTDTLLGFCLDIMYSIRMYIHCIVLIPCPPPQLFVLQVTVGRLTCAYKSSRFRDPPSI